MKKLVLLFMTSMTLMVAGHAGAQTSSPLKVGSRYIVNTLVSAKVINDLATTAPTREAFVLTPKSEFEVLEILDNGQNVRLGLDVESDEDTTSDVVVSMSDLMLGHFSEIQFEDGKETDELDLSNEGTFAARKKRGGMTYCYRDVKKTLIRQKKCSHYPSGVRAELGLKILQNECGMKTIPAPKTQAGLNALPKGAVCVSGGGRPCGKGTSCGHIAIKVGATSWFGAGTRNTPWLPNSKKKGYKPRYVIGCLMK